MRVHAVCVNESPAAGRAFCCACFSPGAAVLHARTQGVKLALLNVWEGAERDRPHEAPGLAFAVSATTLAATPAEATPDSTSAVLGHSQVQITLTSRHTRLISS